MKKRTNTRSRVRRIWRSITGTTNRKHDRFLVYSISAFNFDGDGSNSPQMSEFNIDMKRLLRSIQPMAIALGLLAANALLAVGTPGPTRQEGVKSLRVEKLSNTPGTSPDSLESNQTTESYAIRKIRSR